MTTDDLSPDDREAARLAGERATAETLARLNRTPDEVKAGVDPAGSGESTDYSPISAAEMRGDRVVVTVAALTLSLKPLTRKKVRQFSEMVARWPEVLQFASAVRTPQNKGIDFAQTAELMTGFRRYQHDAGEIARAIEAAKTGVAYERISFESAVSALDVAAMMDTLADTMDEYDALICDSVWLMAEGMTGVMWPPQTAQIATNESDADGEPITETVTLPAPDRLVYLSDLIEDALTLPDYADLLRALKAANGGYKNCLTDRFTPPSVGTATGEH